MVTERVREDGMEIGELARTSGVTVRTIRYYIQQGLLPSAEFSGPATRYGHGHLVRLRLIRSLQARSAPLVEIRSRIGRLGDDEARTLLETLEGATDGRAETGAVASAAGSPTRPAGATPLRWAPGSAAADGAAEAGLLPAASSPWAVAMPRATAASLTTPAPASGDSAVDYVRRVLAGLAPEGTPLSPSPAPAAAEDRTAWQRIALAPDVELHVRADARRMARVERLIEAARQILEADE